MSRLRISLIMQNAIEALLIIAIGIGIPLVIASLIWGFQYELQISWLVFAEIALGYWLMGHLVPIGVTLDPELLTSLGLTSNTDTIELSLAPLGVLLLTIYLARGAGRRLATHDHTIIGAATLLVTFAIITLLLALLASAGGFHINLVTAALLPTLWVALTLGITILVERPNYLHKLQDAIPYLKPGGPRSFITENRADMIRETFIGTGGVLLAVFTVAFTAAGLLTFWNGLTMVSLYESLHAGILGGLAITALQIALLPNVAIYGVAWLSGPGYSIGEGSAISPLGTDMGPVPTFPLLGITPPDFAGWGFIGFVIPILAGFAAHYFIKNRDVSIWTDLLRGGAIALLSAIVIWILGALATGSAGPGRLGFIGVESFTVALWFCVLVLIGALAAAAARYFARISSGV